MRISELARAADVPLATVKYYLRDGLLPPGRATGATQAEYDETHVRLLVLIRVLIGVGGLSLAEARGVLRCMAEFSGYQPGQMHNAVGAAFTALPPQPPDIEPRRSMALVDGLGWRVQPEAPALRSLERALDALDAIGHPVPDSMLLGYADAARRVAELDVASVPDDSPESAATTVVISTLLYEPILLALRRLAQEAASADRFGLEDESPRPRARPLSPTRGRGHPVARG